MNVFIVFCNYPEDGLRGVFATRETAVEYLRGLSWGAGHTPSDEALDELIEEWPVIGAD